MVMEIPQTLRAVSVVCPERVDETCLNCLEKECHSPKDVEAVGATERLLKIILPNRIRCHRKVF